MGGLVGAHKVTADLALLPPRAQGIAGVIECLALLHQAKVWEGRGRQLALLPNPRRIGVGCEGDFLVAPHIVNMCGQAMSSARRAFLSLTFTYLRDPYRASAKSPWMIRIRPTSGEIAVDQLGCG